jgi:hypothetical protein
MQLREYEYLPLVSIQEQSELPKGQPLFDSLFVFENAPVETSVLDRAQRPQRDLRLWAHPHQLPADGSVLSG